MSKPARTVSGLGLRRCHGDTVRRLSCSLVAYRVLQEQGVGRLWCQRSSSRDATAPAPV